MALLCTIDWTRSSLHHGNTWCHNLLWICPVQCAWHHCRASAVLVHVCSQHCLSHPSGSHLPQGMHPEIQQFILPGTEKCNISTGTRWWEWLCSVHNLPLDSTGKCGHDLASLLHCAPVPGLFWWQSGPQVPHPLAPGWSNHSSHSQSPERRLPCSTSLPASDWSLVEWTMRWHRRLFHGRLQLYQ